MAEPRPVRPAAGHPALGAAEYKLAVRNRDGRGVYTFCMCPGGTVVAAASEEGGLCVNGMSNYARDGANCNSALLVSVEPGRSARHRCASGCGTAATGGAGGLPAGPRRHRPALCGAGANGTGFLGGPPRAPPAPGWRPAIPGQWPGRTLPSVCRRLSSTPCARRCRS